MEIQHFGSLPEYDRASKLETSRFSTEDIALELLSRLQKSEIDSSLPDSLIRLYFSLDRLLEKQLEIFANRFSLKHLQGLFYVNYRYWKKHKIPIENATYVDVGCGSINPFGMLFLYLMLGANKGICIDPDPLRDASISLENLARNAGKTIIDPSQVFGDYPITGREIINNLSNFDLKKLSEGNLEGLNNRLSFRQESIFKTSLSDGEADVVISNSVLEHIPDIDNAIAELARITKPGGYGVHNIDGVDHWSYSNPDFHALEFLKVETTDEMVHISNRIRPLSFIEIFDRHDFEVLEINPYGSIQVDEELRQSFVEPFRSMKPEVLELAQACLLVRKRQ